MWGYSDMNIAMTISVHIDCFLLTNSRFNNQTSIVSNEIINHVHRFITCINKDVPFVLRESLDCNKYV